LNAFFAEVISKVVSILHEKSEGPIWSNKNLLFFTLIFGKLSTLSPNRHALQPSNVSRNIIYTAPPPPPCAARNSKKKAE
jgi:hypothetical protein